MVSMSRRLTRSDNAIPSAVPAASSAARVRLEPASARVTIVAGPSAAQVVVRDSVLGAHLNTAQPWTDMSGNTWQAARFAEYKNTGPGSGVNANRPQLTDP